MKKKIKKALSTLLKVAVSLLLVWFVYSKISIKQVVENISGIAPFYFVLATLFYLLSQILSSQRLLQFFHVKEFPLSTQSNFLLYLIGMFYNFFVPGGIGGDAYKVYLLNRQFNWKAKALGATVLADRASGLLAICCWIVLLSAGLPFMQNIYGYFAIPLLLLLGIITAKSIFKKVFPSFQTIFYKGLGCSFVIQGLQLCSVYFILLTLNQSNDFIAYFLLFFLSAILSIFSFSGIGVREFVFLKFASYFDFHPETAVSVGLIFTIITFFVSFPGVFPILFTKKRMKLKENS